MKTILQMTKGFSLPPMDAFANVIGDSFRSTFSARKRTSDQFGANRKKNTHALFFQPLRIRCRSQLQPKEDKISNGMKVSNQLSCVLLCFNYQMGCCMRRYKAYITNCVSDISLISEKLFLIYGLYQKHNLWYKPYIGSCNNPCDN